MTNSSDTIIFQHDESGWEATVENFSIHLDDDFFNIMCTTSEFEETPICDHNDGSCPSHREKDYDADPDACFGSCPHKTEEEVWGDAMMIFNQGEFKDWVSHFRAIVSTGTDGIGHPLEWCDAAKIFAASPWDIDGVIYDVAQKSHTSLQ